MSNYEKRLYDVPVSNCPYCGCKRVVIHEYNDTYENPHSYRVEHIDEKEAAKAGCFDSYYSFDSAEEAVEHANMRDPLTDDEPETITRDGIKEIMRNLAAEVTNGGVEIHGAIPIEDALKSAMQRVDDLLADDEPQEQDSREKLEADIVKSSEVIHTFLGDLREGLNLVNVSVDVIRGWLDRQAAITERNVLGREWNYKDTCDALQERVDNLCASEEIGNKLIAQLLDSDREKNRRIVEYAEKVDELEAENAELKRLWEMQTRETACQSADLVYEQRKVDELKVENAELREKLDAYETSEAEQADELLVKNAQLKDSANYLYTRNAALIAENIQLRAKLRKEGGDDQE